MQSIVLIITYILLFASVLYTFIYYKRLNRELKVFSWFILLSAIVQFFAYYLSSSYKENLFLLHIHVPLGFFFLTLFYQNVFGEFLNKKVLWWVFSIFLILSTLSTIFLQNIHTFNSYALSLESALIMIYALSLYTLLLNPIARDRKRRELKSLMWINSGLFMYYTSGLLLFYFGEVLTSLNPMKFRMGWTFHSFIYSVQLACIFIGLWKYPKK